MCSRGLILEHNKGATITHCLYDSKRYSVAEVIGCGGKWDRVDVGKWRWILPCGSTGWHMLMSRVYGRRALYMLLKGSGSIQG
jgi:hypothetical protein